MKLCFIDIEMLVTSMMEAVLEEETPGKAKSEFEASSEADSNGSSSIESSYDPSMWLSS